MLSYALAIAYALFLWWFSTGVILYLDKRPERTYPWSMAGATLALLAAFAVLVWSRDVATVAGAYAGFTAGVVIWGWMEMSYFMGFITGPRKAPCPEDCHGWRRFRLALSTSIYHELAIVAAAALMLWLTWGAANAVGTWTYLILWLMRWSAKLNLFLGVSNFHADWLPRSQQYLVTYMQTRPINLLFPLSVMVGTACASLFLHRAVIATDAFSASGYTIVGLLLALGVVEHSFLVLPVQDSRLWQWAMPSGQPDAAPGDSGSGLGSPLTP
jgi:putative photosynthetic complex assembly protein 2